MNKVHLFTVKLDRMYKCNCNNNQEAIQSQEVFENIKLNKKTHIFHLRRTDSFPAQSLLVSHCSKERQGRLPSGANCDDKRSLRMEGAGAMIENPDRRSLHPLHTDGIDIVFWTSVTPKTAIDSMTERICIERDWHRAGQPQSMDQ